MVIEKKDFGNISPALFIYLSNKYVLTICHWPGILAGQQDTTKQGKLQEFMVQRGAQNSRSDEGRDSKRCCRKGLDLRTDSPEERMQKRAAGVRNE